MLIIVSACQLTGYDIGYIYYFISCYFFFMHEIHEFAAYNLYRIVARIWIFLRPCFVQFIIIYDKLCVFIQIEFLIKSGC